MITIEELRQNKDKFNAFVEENIGLVYHSIKKLGLNIKHEEYFQEGCVGLIKAAKRYDPKLGSAFSTYAVFLIQGEINKYRRDYEYSQDTCMRIPREIIQTYFHIRKLEDLKDSEICRKLNISQKRLSYVRNAMVCSARIDEFVGNENKDRISMHEVIPSKIDIEEEITEKIFRENFFDSLRKSIAEKEKIILDLHLKGLYQSQIGNELGVSQAQIGRTIKKIIQNGMEIAKEAV